MKKKIQKEFEYDEVIWRQDWWSYKEGDIMHVEIKESTYCARIVFVETVPCFGDNVPEHTIYVKLESKIE
jgi:hypothetical protein